MAVFTVTMVAGPGWDDARPRREQPGWTEHADFMDELVADGFVLLGGPIGNGDHVLLAVEAADEPEVAVRLRPDPWLETGQLVIGQIQSWTIWLDGRRNR
ncbi:MAG: uncharacterized protein QOJ68_106 [Blastococcus sp.]|jgi:hypothetical protein|nr:uncharacterized protein [Blastococcus sp.]